MRGPQGDVFFLIERQDSIQIETEKATGSFSRLAVKWTGNCTYELKLLETNFAFSDSIQQIRKNIPLRSQIIQWTGDYYVFRATRDNSDFVMTDTLWIDQ